VTGLTKSEVDLKARTAYIVMELIRGETLENHINRQGRPNLERPPH
jgi:tRNA A-37 threonylcarbamoyl transferase component Bud32